MRQAADRVQHVRCHGRGCGRPQAHTVVVSGRPSRSSSARSLRLTSGMERSASPMARPHSGSAGHAIDSRSMLSSSNSSFAPALPGKAGRPLSGKGS